MKQSATVVKHTGSHYTLSPLPQWAPFEAVLRGNLRTKGSQSTNPVAVGDKVEYERLSDGSCVITSIYDRQNHIIRKSTNLSRQNHVIAANIDRAFIVCSLYFPEIKFPFLDRILVNCEMFKIPVTLVLNKVDMYKKEAEEEIEYFKDIYNKAGYDMVLCSAQTGEGIEELRKRSQGKVCLFSGESGVGKSSLIRALDPSLQLRTAAISTAHLQGKHTTTFYEMYPLNNGKDGFIIDTPGIRGFGLVGLEKEEISLYFPEMFRLVENCRFQPCTHTHEPGCAIKEAVESGLISPERYRSYLGMLEEEGKYRK